MATSDHPWQLARSDVEHRRVRRERARRNAVRRRRRLAGLTLASVLAAALLWIGDMSRGSQAPARGSFVARTVAPRTGASTSPLVRSGGSLPQTHAYPSGSSPQFKALMASLWAGIVHNSLTPALDAFFPKAAYVRLKAIASAGSDWKHRLVHYYALDIAAAHSLLKGDAAHAALVRVDVPSSYGHWVQAGVCYNSIGYYEMPNARVVYSEGGKIRSFGIASMISWRGVWYVVHLGAILRSTDSGLVDEPANGPGRSLYSATC